jgi:hypothetical protein
MCVWGWGEGGSARSGEVMYSMTLLLLSFCRFVLSWVSPLFFKLDSSSIFLLQVLRPVSCKILECVVGARVVPRQLWPPGVAGLSDTFVIPS